MEIGTNDIDTVKSNQIKASNLKILLTSFNHFNGLKSFRIWTILRGGGGGGWIFPKGIYDITL